MQLIPIEIFTSLWAAGMLAHQSKVELSAWTPVDPLLVLVAGVALLQPGTRFVLPALAAAQLASLWQHLPTTPNHWVFIGFMSIGILACWAAAGFRGNGADLEERFAPLARTLTVALYALATFHKLNWGYLDPEMNCFAAGLRVVNEYTSVVVPFQTVIGYGSAIGILAVEFALFALLLRAKTWLYGCMLGVAFHSLTLETQFAALMLPAYVFFSPLARAPELAAELDRRIFALTGNRLHIHGLIVLSGLCYALSAPFASAPPRIELAGIIGRKIVWFSCMVPIFLVCCRYFWDTRQRSQSPAAGLPPMHPALWAVPLLLVAWGMSPYLGLRTTPVFSMFSNLRTEGATSNHLLLGSNPLKLFDYQDDWVHVQPSASPLLKLLTRDGPINYLEFKRLVRLRAKARNRPIGIVYARGGEIVDIADVTQDAELMAEESIWSAKFLSFRRPFYWEERPACPW